MNIYLYLLKRVAHHGDQHIDEDDDGAEQEDGVHAVADDLRPSLLGGALRARRQLQHGRTAVTHPERGPVQVRERVDHAAREKSVT